MMTYPQVRRELEAMALDDERLRDVKIGYRTGSGRPVYWARFEVVEPKPDDLGTSDAPAE